MKMIIFALTLFMFTTQIHATDHEQVVENYNKNNLELKQESDSFKIVDTTVMKRYKHDTGEFIAGGIAAAFLVVCPPVSIALLYDLSTAASEHKIYQLLRAVKVYLTNHERENRIFDDNEKRITYKKSHKLLINYYKLFTEKSFDNKVTFLAFLNRLNDYANTPYHRNTYFNNYGQLIDYLFTDNGKKFYSKRLDN